MTKIMLALVLIGSPLLAAQYEYFGVKDDTVMKVVACTNGIKNFTELKEEDLAKGFQFKHEGEQLQAKLAEKKFEHNGRFYNQVHITNVDTGARKATLVLDYHDRLGRILLEDMPVAQAGEAIKLGKNGKVYDLDSIKPGDKNDPRVRPLTGLANVEHRDPKTNQTFYSWHMLDAVATLVKPKGE